MTNASHTGCEVPFRSVSSCRKLSTRVNQAAEGARGQGPAPRMPQGRGVDPAAHGGDGGSWSRGPRAAQLRHVCDLPSSPERAPRTSPVAPGTPPRRLHEAGWHFPGRPAAWMQTPALQPRGGLTGRAPSAASPHPQPHLGGTSLAAAAEAARWPPAGARCPEPLPRLDSLLAAPRSPPARPGAHSACLRAAQSPPLRRGPRKKQALHVRATPPASSKTRVGRVVHKADSTGTGCAL